MNNLDQQKSHITKDYRIIVSFTAKEFRKLEEQCAVFGKTKTEVIREALGEYYLNHYWV